VWKAQKAEDESAMQQAEAAKLAAEQLAKEMQELSKKKIVENNEIKAKETEHLVRETEERHRIEAEELRRLKSELASKEAEWLDKKIEVKSYEKASESARLDLQATRLEAERISKKFEESSQKHFEEIAKVRKEVEESTRKKTEEKNHAEAEKEMKKTEYMWKTKVNSLLKVQDELKLQLKSLEQTKLEVDIAKREAVTAKLEAEKAVKGAVEIEKLNSLASDNAKVQIEKSVKGTKQKFLVEISQLKAEWSTKEAKYIANEAEFRRKESLEKSLRDADVAAKLKADSERRKEVAGKMEAERMVLKVKGEANKKLNDLVKLKAIEMERSIKQAERNVRYEVAEKIANLEAELALKKSLWLAKEAEMSLQLAEEKGKKFKTGPIERTNEEIKEPNEPNTSQPLTRLKDKDQIYGDDWALRGNEANFIEIVLDKNANNKIQKEYLSDEASATGSVTSLGRVSTTGSVASLGQKSRSIINVDVTLFQGGKSPDYRPMRFSQKIGPLIRPAVMKARSGRSRKKSPRKTLVEV